MLLHNLSVQQGRMVKVTEIRDLSNFAISDLLRNGRPIIARIKQFLGTVQDFYPEVIHKIFIFNAPSSFSTLFSLISSLLNERMRSKIQVFPIGTPVPELTKHFKARAIWSWLSQGAASVDFSRAKLERGEQESLVKWLKKGETARWNVELLEGPDLLFRRAFLLETANSGGGGVAANAEETVKAGSSSKGTYTADGDGCLWLCIDNSAAWWNAKVVSLVVT